MKKRRIRPENRTKHLQPPVTKTQSQTLPTRDPPIEKRSRSLYKKLATFLEVVVSPPPAEPFPVEKNSLNLKEYLKDSVSVPVSDLKDFTKSITKMTDEAPTSDRPGQPDGGKDDGRKGSASSMPAVDSGILEELRESDVKATKLSKAIESLKKDITKFSKKTDMNDDDVKKLKQLHTALNEKLSDFEKIGNNVQRLLGIANLTPQNLAQAMSATPGGDEESRYIQEAGPLKKGIKVDETVHLTQSEQEKMAQLEDKLPKVIICGTGQEEVPKIIVCERIEPVVEEESLARGLAEKLCDSYKMQEKLATEAAEMEGSRYSLQEEIITKDRRVDTLQKQVESLQTEMKLIAKENAELQKKLLQTCQPSHPPMCKRELYQKFTGSLPDWDTRKATNNDLENALEHMEGVVGSMQNEIGEVQAERKMLKTQTQLLQCAFSHQPTCQKELAAQHREGIQTNPCVKELEGQLRDTNEKYNRLNCDFNGKIAEIACLRTELKNERIEIEHMAERVCYAEARADDLLERLKIIDIEKQTLMVNREQFIDMEQQLCIAKHRIQSLQEENESLQIVTQEQSCQIEDYKEKYLNAQQTVEEQKRVVERLHVQGLEAKENLLLEIQQFKSQIEEKLTELEPLPEKLRLYETKLQLSQQNIDDLNRELMEVKEAQFGKGTNEDSIGSLKAKRAALEAEIAQKNCELKELQKETIGLRATVARFEELTTQHEWQYEEKVSEVTQLASQIVTVREEAARQVVKTKDRCATVRKLMTAQISTLERQLAESRASASAASKETEEVRMSMQLQISNLGDNFGQAQMRIKSLQDHVNYLSTSAL